VTIHELHRRVKSLNQSIRHDVEGIVKKTSYEMTTLNQNQLFNYGIGSDGLKLAPYKNKYYAQEKNYMNRRPGLGIPDLRLSGQYYNGMNVIVENYTYKITSSDSKADKLERMYPKAMGLTTPSMKSYAHGVFFIELRTLITSKTGLKFA